MQFVRALISGAQSPSVATLTVHPVKSCAGINVKRALLTPMGFSCDRRWMVVKDNEEGSLISQRQCAKLCQVRASLPEAALLGRWEEVAPDACLELSAPGQSKLRVPLHPPADQPLRHVTVWEFSGEAYDEGDDAAAWLSAYIGQPARLVRYAGSGSPQASTAPVVRAADAEFAGPGHEVAFPDGFPCLVAMEESLQALNKATGEKLPMSRFRPNIVLRGVAEAWGDDEFRRIAITPGGPDGSPIELSYIKPCDRCKVPTINQDTAVEGEQPLKALQEGRSGKQLGWNAGGRKSWTHSVFFGWNAVAAQDGIVSVGDSVEVLERKPWSELPVPPARA